MWDSKNEKESDRSELESLRSFDRAEEKYGFESEDKFENKFSSEGEILYYNSVIHRRIF